MHYRPPRKLIFGGLLAFPLLAAVLRLPSLLKQPYAPHSLQMSQLSSTTSARNRIAALQPVIQNICRISGTPGVSVGVIHHDELIYSFSAGHSDVESGKAVDENTVFHIMSMSKTFTAVALGILVDEGRLDWNAPIRQVLPDFNHFSQEIAEKTNLIDLVAHRTGLAGHNTLWMQEYGRLSIPKDQTMDMFNALHPVKPFRTEWLYSNWGPAIAALMIEKVTGMTWGIFLKERLFQPLGMNRTFTTRNPDVDNVAHGYMALADASVLRNERPHVEDGKIMAGGGAVQSCVHDLLIFYRALVKAYKEQSASGNRPDQGSPFKQLPFIFAPKINLPGSESSQQAYSLGLVRTQLPGVLGAMSTNGMYVENKPVAGRGSNKTVWHHNGSLAAFLSSVHLVPETNSVIVVLTNSIANNDAADWIGQMLLEGLIDSPEKNDYEALAKESADTCVHQWEELFQTLNKRQKHGTSPKVLSEYVGKYFSSVGNWFMEIFLKDNFLHMCIQGDRSETYLLHHYHNDTFSYPLTQLENAQRGRFPISNPELYLLNFQSEDDKILGMVWSQDPSVPEGEAFLKEGASMPRSELKSQSYWKRFLEESRTNAKSVNGV